MPDRAVFDSPAIESSRRPLEAQDLAAPTATIRVVREGTGSPLAGCEVLACDMDLFLGEVGARGAGMDQRARRQLLHELADSGITDASGEVRLPLRGSRQWIDASHPDGLWGHRTLSGSPEGMVEVVVGEDRTLRVVVRSTPEGAPVPGVPVMLCGDSLRAPTFTAWSAADGSAVFGHVQELLRRSVRWHLGPGFPVCDPYLLTLSADALPSGVVELVLPPTGTLVLVIRDESERPVLRDVVAAEITAFSSPARTLERSCLGSTRALSFDGAGRAVIPHTGLELPLRVTLKPADPGSSRPPVTADLEGPRSPGESVEHALRWPSEPAVPVLTGRFVRADDSPWPAASLEVRTILFPAPAGPVEVRRLELEEGGRFRLELHEPWSGGGSRELHLSCTAPDSLAGIEGRLDLSRDFPPGETDLGSVLLDRGVVLVAGVVVAEDGSFVLTAIPGRELPESQLRLRVRCQGFLPASTELPAGSVRQRVVLQQAGAVEGSVRLAPGQEPSEVSILLEGEGGTWTPRVGPDGSFRQDGLPPGRLGLEAGLRAWLGVEPTISHFAVEDLWIVGGETNRDPRIQGIVVHDDRSVLGLEILDPVGGPIEGARVRTSEGIEARCGRQGQARVAVRNLPVDLSVSAYGYRTVHLESVSEDRRLVLDEGPRVRLVTDVQAVGRDPDHVLGFRIRPVDERGRLGPVLDEIPLERQRFGASGEALLSMPRAGEYSVEFVLYLVDEGVGRSTLLPPSTRRSVTVLDSSEVQTLRVEIGQDAVDAAVGRR